MRDRVADGVPIGDGQPGRLPRRPHVLTIAGPSGEIVFGTSADAATGMVTDPAGSFAVGAAVTYLAWLEPPLTFPTVRIVGTLDGVPWFDIPTPIDTVVNGPLPYTKVVGTLPPPAVAWPGTLRLQIFDAARVQLAEGTLVFTP